MQRRNRSHVCSSNRASREYAKSRYWVEFPEKGPVSDPAEMEKGKPDGHCSGIGNYSTVGRDSNDELVPGVLILQAGDCFDKGFHEGPGLLRPVSRKNVHKVFNYRLFQIFCQKETHGNSRPVHRKPRTLMAIRRLLRGVFG
jgi:hypothetical protein